MIPVIMQGDLTGRWYIVTRYTKKDGCIVAQTKYYGPVHHPGRYDRLIDGMDAAIKAAGEEVT